MLSVFYILQLIIYLRKTTEAHSIMLQQMQQCVLGMNGNVNNVEAAGISETSLLDKKGAIYIAGCELDFPEGSFQTDVVAKLSCFYPLQVSLHVTCNISSKYVKTKFIHKFCVRVFVFVLACVCSYIFFF